MKYNNKNIRRQDRLLDESRAAEILKSAEYGVLSMVDREGLPYGIPINFVWDGGSSVYLHCALEGKKLQALRQNRDVSFCIVGRVHLLPGQFTTEYESLVLRGTASIDLGDDERWEALRQLLLKLSPDDLDVGMKYAEKSFHRTAIIRLDFTEFSGKRKYVHR